jgi:hypothetical protein
MRSASKWLYLITPILIGVAFFLRLWHLDQVPLRGDEAFTAIHWTNPPFSERWLFFLEYEPNPASMVTYWAWSLGAGVSEFGLRYFSVLANTLGVAVIIALGRRLFARNDVALWAGGFWAIHPFLIWHAQDARQYGFYVTLAVLNMLLLHRALHHKKPRWWAYILFQTFTLYLYYFELFVVIAQVLYVWMNHRKQFGRFVRIWVGIGILLIPLAIQTYVVLFGREYAGTATTADFGALFTEFIPTLLWGTPTGTVGVVLVSVGVLGMAWFLKTAKWLLWGWIVIPLAVLFIISNFTAVFLPRYVIAVTPALILTLTGALGMLYAKYPKPSSVLGTLDRYMLPMIIFAICLIQVYAYFYVDPPKSFDWRGLMALVETRASADDLIINDTSDTALEYYNRGDMAIFFIPEDNPPINSYMPALLADHTDIFLLNGGRTGDAHAYLSENAQRLPIAWNGLDHFRGWEVNPSEITVPLDIRIGDVARLVGYSWLDDDTVLLYWEAMRQTDAPLNILTHITPALDAPPTVVLDHQVAESTIPTSTWTVGTVYRDPIVIPSDLPSGEYLMLIGMYETTPPYPRLPIFGATDNDGRAVLFTMSR